MSTIPPVFVWPVQFCAFTTAATYIASIITSNVSQVDRLWTFLPTIYTAYFALLPLWARGPVIPFLPLVPFVPNDVPVGLVETFSPRALMIFGLVFTWMCRLSYNTYRRGLFSLQDEDYRWAILRGQLPPFLFQIVNLTFISGIQNVILFLLGIPAYRAIAQPHTPLAASDYTLAALAVVTLAFEFTADNQQFAFQTYKQSGVLKGDGTKSTYDPKAQWPGARLNWTLADARRGFITRGLWAWSRHPNFACEQTFWWLMTLTPLLSPSSTFIHDVLENSRINNPYYPINFPSSLAALQSSLATLTPLAPALVLSTLFYSSTIYTEKITAGKYPAAYKLYQERVGMFGVIRTLEKAIVVKWRGRGKIVEEGIWGKGVVSEKKVE